MANRPSEPCDDITQEDLVAYLDGELDTGEVERLERRLAEDAQLRGQLQDLQRAWDLLDYLPRTPIDPEFTRSTLEMVALSAAHDAKSLGGRSARRRGIFWLATAVLMLGAGGLGYWVTSGALAVDNRNLVRDLPVIESLDAYRQAESIDFLQALRKRGYFVDPAPDESTVGTILESPEARRQRLSKLSALEKDELQRNANRFHQLGDGDRARLRRLKDELASHEDAAELQLVMVRYGDWLATLASGQRLELLDLPADARVESIGKLIAVQELRPEDAKALLSWLHDFVREHQEQILAALPEERRIALNQLPDRDRKRNALAYAYVHRASQSVTPSDVEIDRLEEKLADRARAALRSQDDRESRVRLIVEWSRTALGDSFKKPSAGRLPGVARAELMRFYQELTAEDRERLEGLSRGRFVFELQRMFRQRGDGSLPAGPSRRRGGAGSHAEPEP